MSIETIRQAPIPARLPKRFRKNGSEQGAIAIMTAFVIVIMIGLFAMSLDISRSYNRKVELQTFADAVALAAAAALDGTPTGIDNAVTSAGEAAANLFYSYANGTVSWSNAALTFGVAADSAPSDWMDGATAKPQASRIFFVRVDTSALEPKYGEVQNFLASVFSAAFAKTAVASSAVAGRDSLNVLPLAVCANSNTKAIALPSGELVEYGFRRGVSYDLMHLNPGGRTPENFLVNPIAPPGTTGTTMKTRMDVVAPFVCTGKMAIPTLQGGDITVERGFPINVLFAHLNSRFGTYVPPCVASTAPADSNTTSFTLANATWMKYKPDGLAANSLASPDPLLTVAEKPAGATKTAYGPLWSYAKAVRYSNGGVEPAAGFVKFTTADWSLLYNPGSPAAQSYPNPTPYEVTGGSAPYKPSRNTRMLRVPLLSCPVAPGAISKATVIGIAKFFMTVPASTSALYAEFAGIANETPLGGNVRLYR